MKPLIEREYFMLRGHLTHSSWQSFEMKDFECRPHQDELKQNQMGTNRYCSAFTYIFKMADLRMAVTNQIPHDTSTYLGW